MRMTPVQSSVIHSVGYDPETRKLLVRFHSGSLYEYVSVPPLVYAELMNSDSPGTYLDHNIRDIYTCRQVLKMVPVASTSIHSVGYDPSVQVLYVKFHNGYTYEYSGVPPEIYAGLMNAYSIGAYMNQHVRGHYPYRRIWTERARVALPAGG